MNTTSTIEISKLAAALVGPALAAAGHESGWAA
jgi:hypothetical protein